ncbi:MAG: hypothetical protein LBL44_07160 [Treponema sp.]|jgi:hypothetical protein|nr:hypothetical protein [Treponema sp.]
MIRFPGGRFLFAVLAACFVLAALTAGTAALHINHECEGADCPVCLRIETARNVLKGSVPAAVTAPFFSAGREIKNIHRSAALSFTPVALNTKSTT